MEISLDITEEMKSIFGEVFEEKSEIIADKVFERLQSNKKRTIQSVADEFEVDALTIRNWLKAGKLKGNRIGRRIYIIQKDLDQALTEVKSLKYKR